MYIHEDIVMMIVKERMDDAMRFAEHRRALRLARASRPSARVRLGMALIRLGRWLMGGSSPSAGTTIRLGQAHS
jgi:hypothetical protein